MKICEGCIHLRVELRTDFLPHTESYWCGDVESHYCEHNKAPSGVGDNWIGFLPHTPTWCPGREEAK